MVLPGSLDPGMHFSLEVKWLMTLHCPLTPLHWILTPSRRP